VTKASTIDRATAWLKANRAAALGVAGAGVAGLALVMRRRSSSSGGGNASTPPAKTLAVGDTTATDLYNALQPDLEAIFGELRLRNDGAGVFPVAPVAPMPTVPTAPAPVAPAAPTPQPAPVAQPVQTTAPTSTLSVPVPSLYYTPSGLDYEVSAGRSRPVVRADQSVTYVGSRQGSGPVVPVNQRIPGERYDSTGRVIL